MKREEVIDFVLELDRLTDGEPIGDFSFSTFVLFRIDLVENGEIFTLTFKG